MNNNNQKPLAIEIFPNENKKSSQADSIFNFDSQIVHVQIDQETGEIWFLAKDICTILGYVNARDAIINHVDKDDVAKRYTISTYGSKGATRNQLENYVNESGLYALIFGSKKSEAKRFKKWVTSEVLPSIRKIGSYSIHQDSNSESPKLPLKYSLKFISEEFDASIRIIKHFDVTGNQATLSACQMIRKTYDIDILCLTEQKGLISESQEHDFSPTEIGGMLKPVQSARKVNQLLIEAGFQIRSGNPKLNRVVYQPTELGKSFAILKDTMKKHSDGTPILQVRWFEKIVEFLQSRVAIN